jgi:preprotein translocase subunit Sec61beta
MRTSGWALKLFVIMVVFTAAIPCRADAPTREYQVKAAFIYNFTQFIQWPDSAFASKDCPFVVATLGTDPFGGALDEAMSGKTVANHSISVQHFASVDGLGPCHLLFVPASQDSALGDIFAKLNGIAVLTVGESDAFSSAGGGIRFFLEEKKMRFEIDPDPITSVGIKVSAKLMKLARIYKKKT